MARAATGDNSAGDDRRESGDAKDKAGRQRTEVQNILNV
jgi:hypothetical protein